MGIKHRCLDCRARHTFSEPWHTYKGCRTRHCRKCGGIRFYIIHESTCYCQAYYFPHRLDMDNCIRPEATDKASLMDYVADYVNSTDRV